MKAVVLVNVVPGAIIDTLVDLLHSLFRLRLIVDGIQLPEDRIHLGLQGLVTGDPGLDGHIIDRLVISADIGHCQVNKVLQLSQFFCIQLLLGGCER